MLAFLKKIVSFGRRSLAGRMMLALAATVTICWLSLVAWVVTSALEGGRAEIERDMSRYARQVLTVMQVMSDEPENIRQSVARVEAIEREPDKPGDDPAIFAIEVWLNNQQLHSTIDLPTEVPKESGFHELEHKDLSYWSYALADDAGKVVLRLTTEAGGRAALLWPDMVILFLPLFISLPLLLIPAWFSTRHGLRPLDATAAQISDRVERADLTPLPQTSYRELDPVVDATNRLMSRLDKQLRRERGFVADVAHEMKTPLAILQTNLGVLEKTLSTQRRDSALADLKSGIVRSNHLIAQLLRFARLDSEWDQVAQKRELDLAEFIRQRLGQAETLARSKGVVLTLTAPESFPLLADADAIAAVVDNLLDNAIKYSPQGGNVHVCLEHVPVGYDDGPQLIFSVEDQGPGIAPEQTEKMFERFQRGNLAEADRDVIDGAGLGLSIVARAASRLNGRIELLPAHDTEGQQGKPTQHGLLARLVLPAPEAASPLVDVA